MSDVEIWSPDPEAIVAAAPIGWTPDPSWFHEVPEWLDATWEDGVVQLGPGDEVTRVAALVAPYGECILDGGRNGQACFTPPISPTNYEYAHVGALRTADGSIARVANIGGGVPHYDPNKPLDMSPAVHHYANTASRVMVGRYYDRPDLGGIIFLGATWPGVDPQVARSAPLSGDWRWVDSMQDWDFAGAQQVLNPGFRPNRHNRRRASTVGRHSLLAPALSNMEFAMVASLGPSGDEHMLGAWVPSDDGNVLAPATLIDLAELSAIVASLEDELAVLIEDSTPLLPFYNDQPTEAIVASARKRRKKRSDAWLATHPNPKSTPRDIVGKHGHRPHGPSILSPRIYEHLRAKGYSKAKAAAISNAMFNKRRGKPPKSVKGTKGLVGVGKVASLGTPVDLGDATIDGEPMTKGNIILVPDNPDALTVPGGDPADVLHATLKFLGDLDPWDDEQRERAEGIVGEWARTHGPFTATVAGVGELGDDGAVVYHFDGDDLQAARADLSAAIDDGTAPDTTDTYPSFKPHVTAGYGIDAPPVPTEPITFSRARVQWADEALEWPLGQPVEAPVAAARPRKRLRQAESLFDGPNAGRVGGGRHDYHDPNTGEFAPLGYVSPQVLRKLLSDNPTLRREAELAIRTKFDSPKAQPWVRAFQGATPAKRGKIARNARREIIGDRPDGTTADDRKAQVAWDRASDVVARGLSRGTGGEDRMVDVPDALDDGHPRPVGITPSGAQVFRDEDFTRLRPHELRPGDLIGNAERDDGLETVEVTAVRTDGGRTLVDVGTSEVPYARDDIVKVLRRPDELTAAEARKPKPVNPDQGGLFDDPVPAPVEPEPELSGPEADAAAMGAMGRMVFERVAQGEVLRKADEAFDKDSLDKLVDLGVIEPAPRPDKRKAQQYVLTAKGTAALPIIQQATRDRDRRRREKWEAKNGITPPPAPVVPVAPRPEPEPPQVVNATPYHVEAIRRWAEGTIDENASGARFEATSRIADVNGDKVRVDVNVRRRDGDSAGARFSLVIDTTDRSLSSGGNVSGGEQLDREAASAIKRSALKDDFVIRKVVLDDTDPRFPGVRDGWTPDDDLDLPDDDEIAEIEAELGFDAGPDDVVATESRGARPGAGQGGLFDDPDLFGDEPDTPGDATPETDGSLESLSDTDLATVKAAAIEWVNVTPEPDAMRQLADVLDEEARRAELAGDTDRAAKLRANAAKWRKSAGDADEPDPEPTPEPEAEVDPEVERRAGYETVVADTTTIIDANRTAAEREGADPFAVNFLADTLDRRAAAYDELGRTDDAAADRAHAERLRGALAERQAREEAARNVPTLEAILGSSTFDSGRTLELGRLVNGNPDAVLGDTASRVSLGAITTAIRTLDGDLAPVEPGDRFSADSTTAAVGLALLRGARVSTIPNGIAIELSDGQAGTGGSGRYLLIRDSVDGQKLEAYDADGRRTFSGGRLPFAHFTGILQPRPTGNMPDGARNAIDSARADVANPDVNTLDVLAGHRDAFVASLSTVAPPEEWHQHPGIVAAVTEFGDVLRDAVAETEAGIDLDMSAGLTEDVAAASKSFDLADTLVEFADRLASDGGGFDPQDLDGHATIAEFLKATDGEFVSFADSGKLSDGSTRQSIRFAYTHESGERRTMDVDLMGNDWNPDDPTMSVSIYRRGGGGYRSRDVRLRGDDVRKADLKQLRSHVRATRALNRDRKRSAALGKADEVNASGTTQRRNAQAAAAVLASLGVERGLDDDTADTIKVNSGTGVITRRKTVNLECLATALGRSRTVKATPAKKRGAASDADLLTVGMAQYPTSWIESLGDHTFLIARRGDANSGYNVDMSRWTSAGAPNGSYLSIPGKGDVGANVIVHEVGHTMEHKVPGLREFVLAHLDTLHAGSDPAKDLPGYRSTRGYEDDIKRVYTRRVYVGNGGDPHGTWASVRSKITSTEYLTTGMETLVPEGGSTEDDFYGIDPVHDAFILGVVATFDPNAVPAAGTVVAP